MLTLLVSDLLIPMLPSPALDMGPLVVREMQKSQDSSLLRIETCIEQLPWRIPSAYNHMRENIDTEQEIKGETARMSWNRPEEPDMQSNKSNNNM